MPTDEELLAMSAVEYKDYANARVTERKERIRHLKKKITAKKKQMKFKSFKKSYTALEKAIRKAKIKKLKEFKLKSVQKKRTNILSRIEDKIPSIYGRKNHKQTFLGRI